MFKLLNYDKSDNKYDYSKAINANSLHNKNIYGKGVTIAIIDTGCDLHYLLNNNIIGGRNFTDEGAVDDYTDLNGHGTHVAGIIAAEFNEHFNSIAPQSKLLILKALNSKGEGSLKSIISAIRYAIDYGVDIINMSLGANRGNKELYEVILEAIDRNISIVCASGNSGDDNPYTDELEFPGSYEEVIEVGAIDNQYDISDFSNSNKFVDIIAPGEDIMSTFLHNSFQSLTGTSMAAPIISGALALLIQWSNNEFDRRLSEKELFALLIKNTKTLDIKRTLQGHGYIYLNL